MKIEFPRQILEKFSDIKFHENPFSGSRVVPCGWTDTLTDGSTDRLTDREDEPNSRFSQFANAPKMEFLSHSKNSDCPQQRPASQCIDN